MAEVKAISREEARLQFDSFDADGNGVLDAAELFQLAGGLGVLMTDEDVALALKAIDSDGNGTIEFEEFFTWLSNPENHGDKGGFTMLRLRASLMAASAVRFMNNLGNQKQDVNIDITVGEVKKAEVYVQYQAMKGHVLTEDELKSVPEGGFYGCYDIVHPEGDTLIRELFDLFMTVMPREANMPVIKLKDVSPTVSRFILISPAQIVRELAQFNQILALVESKMGDASLRMEYGFSYDQLINNLQFGIRDLASFALHMKGSVPYGLPHFIANKMGVPCAPDAPVAPEGKQEPIFDMQLNISKNLIHMVMSSVPEVARLPFRQLFDQFVVSRFVFEEGEGYSKKSKRNQLARCLLVGKMATATLSRYITEFQSVHFRSKSGFGVTVECAGVNFEQLSQLMASIDTDRLTEKGMKV